MTKLDYLEKVAVAANAVCQRVFGDRRNCVACCFVTESLMRSAGHYSRVLPCQLFNAQNETPLVDTSFDVGWYNGHCIVLTDGAGLADPTIDQTGIVDGPIVIQLSRHQIDKFTSFERISTEVPGFGTLKYQRTKTNRREFIADRDWIRWLRSLVEQELAAPNLLTNNLQPPALWAL
jgi:hypothetical protein